MNSQALRPEPEHSSPICPTCGQRMWLTMMSGAHDVKDDTRLFRCRSCRTEAIEPLQYKTAEHP